MELTNEQRSKFNIYMNHLFDLFDMNPKRLQMMGSMTWQAPLPLSSGDVDLIEYVKHDQFGDFWKTTWKQVIKELRASNSLFFVKMRVNDDFKTSSLSRLPNKQVIQASINKHKESEKNWIKFDMVFQDPSNYVFKDISMIYAFSKPLTNQQNHILLLNDIDELYTDGKYYKLLKRLYVYAQMVKKTRVQGMIGKLLSDPILYTLYTCVNYIEALLTRPFSYKTYTNTSQIIKELLRKVGYSAKTVITRLDKPTKKGLTELNVYLSKKLNEQLVSKVEVSH